MLSLVIAGVVASTLFAGSAEAGDRRGSRYRRADDRREYRYDRRDYRHDRYVRARDVVVIRNYYRSAYQRSLPPGLQKKYVRSGYLPPGWARRMRPVPVYIEREMVRVPRGYYRGVIDNRVVVYDNRGFILDVALLF